MIVEADRGGTSAASPRWARRPPRSAPGRAPVARWARQLRRCRATEAGAPARHAGRPTRPRPESPRRGRRPPQGDRAGRTNGLVMKLTDAEWQWDRKKLTFYFTAEKRVDFRALVRDLASMFRTRIELKQIGVRDEAERLSGVGRCGREYCCSSWLPELAPVNLGVAKDQQLSLNPSQISGACGRLMCCLRYEHEFYVRPGGASPRRASCSRRRAVRRRSSRWTSFASGSSSGAKSTARGSSRWCNCGKRSRPGATCSARPSPGAGWRWRRSHLPRRRWRRRLPASTSCPSTSTVRGAPRRRRRAAARPRREAHRTDGGGGGTGGTRATTRRHRPEARGP